ncbi:hypothetical protein CRS_01810 [Chryseobacterium sp. ON_d1]|nr:hypothetical protein CRS_01810 [Chryseobacterium sp. ON_d1]
MITIIFTTYNLYLFNKNILRKRQNMSFIEYSVSLAYRNYFYSGNNSNDDRTIARYYLSYPI